MVRGDGTAMLWFNFPSIWSFSLFWFMEVFDNEYKTKENTKIEAYEHFKISELQGM